MATGLAMPVGVNSSGGGKLTSGSANDDKIIRIALGDDENENAFQQSIGIGSGMIFGISDEQIRARVVRRIIEVFRRFEAQQRFILRTETIRWSEDASKQELSISFSYVSIENDEERDFRQTFSSSSGSTSASLNR